MICRERGEEGRRRDRKRDAWLWPRKPSRGTGIYELRGSPLSTVPSGYGSLPQPLHGPTAPVELQLFTPIVIQFSQILAHKERLSILAFVRSTLHHRWLF